jgi:serine/threonine protein kinase
VLAVGIEIGQYRIERQLGEGGMGAVYRALDTKLGRPVAIKSALAGGRGRRGTQAISARAARFDVPGAFAGPNPSIYAYAKITAQRNIFRVPVP